MTSGTTDAIVTGSPDSFSVLSSTPAVTPLPHTPLSGTASTTTAAAVRLGRGESGPDLTWDSGPRGARTREGVGSCCRQAPSRRGRPGTSRGASGFPVPPRSRGRRRRTPAGPGADSEPRFLSVNSSSLDEMIPRSRAGLLGGAEPGGDPRRTLSGARPRRTLGIQALMLGP